MADPHPSTPGAHTPPAFVLVHGGNLGGWCWQRTARILRRAGHDVFTPTLTGYGDRHHLGHEGVGLDTWVQDVVNVLEYEDLRDVVLVGHSLGGLIIPQVAERLGHRVRRCVWMASMVLRDGETMAPYIERARGLREERGQGGAHWMARLPTSKPSERDFYGTSPDHPEWIMARVTVHPGGGAMQPAKLSGYLAAGIPSGFVIALRDISIPPDMCREFAARLPDCRIREVDASHNLMLSQPALTAAALLEMMD